MEKKLESIFGNINDWLKFAETKSATLIAFDGLVIFGILRILKDVQLKSEHELYVYIVITQLIISLLIALTSLIPNLSMPWFFKKKQPSETDNLLYFEDIAKYTKSTYLHALYQATGQEARTITPYEKMMTHQIIVNSVIARRKYKLFKLAIWVLLSAIVTPIGAFILFEIR